MSWLRAHVRHANFIALSQRTRSLCEWLPRRRPRVSHAKSPPTKSTIPNLKDKILHLDTDCKSSIQAYKQLRAMQYHLSDRHCAVLLGKAFADNNHSAISHILSDIEVSQRNGRDHSQYDTQSLDFLHICRFRMLHALRNGEDDVIRDCFYTCIHEKRNRMGINERDPFNLLLRLECLFPFPTEPMRSIYGRVEKILSAMNEYRLTVSANAAHTFARFALIKYKKEKDSGESMLATLFQEYPNVFIREPWLISHFISTAACVNDVNECFALLRFASELGIPVYESVFGHVLRFTEADGRDVDEIFDAFKRRNAIVSVQAEGGRPGQKLLHTAVNDRDLYQIMVLLHEMEHHKVQGNSKSIIALLKLVANHRRHCLEAQYASESKSLVEPGCPSIAELFEMYPFVLGQCQTAIAHGVRLSAIAGEYDDGLKLLRTTIWTTDIYIPVQVFSSLLYTTMREDRVTGESVYPVHPRQSNLMEIEGLYDQRYPDNRGILYSMIIRHCEYRDDFATFLQFMDRWQQITRIEDSPVLSPLTSKRATRFLVRQLYAVRKVAKNNDDVMHEDESILPAFMNRYDRVLVASRRVMSDLLLMSLRMGYLDGVIDIFEMSIRDQTPLSTPAYMEGMLALEEKYRDDTKRIESALEYLVSIGEWDIIREKYPDKLKKMSHPAP